MNIEIIEEEVETFLDIIDDAETDIRNRDYQDSNYPRWLKLLSKIKKQLTK